MFQGQDHTSGYQPRGLLGIRFVLSGKGNHHSGRLPRQEPNTVSFA